jgi:hypothetical protein
MGCRRAHHQAGGEAQKYARLEGDGEFPKPKREGSFEKSAMDDSMHGDPPIPQRENPKDAF